MLSIIGVGLIGWTMLSIVLGVATGLALRFCGRRDGMMPVPQEQMRKSA